MQLRERFTGLSRDQRLELVGARIHKLETRTPGAIDIDKLLRAEIMFWRVVEESVPDYDWVDFCLGDKMHKYLKEVCMSDKLQKIIDLIDEVFDSAGAYVGQDQPIVCHYWCDETTEGYKLHLEGPNNSFDCFFTEEALLAGEFDGDNGMMTFVDTDGVSRAISFTQEIPYEFDTEELGSCSA